MLIRIPKSHDLRESDVTDQTVYAGRRRFLKTAALGLGGLGAGAIVPPALLAGVLTPTQAQARALADAPQALLNDVAETAFGRGEELTPHRDVVRYNNFYEFGTGKGDPALLAASLKPRPWTLKVEGEVANPGTFDVDALIKRHQLEERIYRFRCVEAWSIVVPWVGFSLAELIKAVEPTSKAKYVAFETLADPTQMPGLNNFVLQWPYVEGLRMDEALHPLTMLTVGLYGRVLPNQNGAPLRLVVPWKYGFKSIKSIVAIRFVETQPPTSWNIAAPNEYGFFSNVNPNVDHRRWSQAKERRIGDFFKRKTLMMNGYADAVAPMYAAMDLAKHY